MHVVILCIFSLSDASFSESLYGLRRRAVKITADKGTTSVESSDKVYNSGLRKHQKVLSVVFLVSKSAFGF